MSWARYDDELAMNRKVVALRAYGLRGTAALGLHLLANTWCRHNGTKGHVPSHVPSVLAGKEGPKLAAILVEVGMFDAASGGWEIHDYAEYHDPNDPEPDRSAADRKKELSIQRAKAGRLGGLAKAKQTASKATDLPVANDLAKGWQCSSPVPVPDPTVTSSPTTSKSVPDEAAGGRDRLNAIADAYATQALSQAKARTTVDNEDAYRRKARTTALTHDDLGRLSALFPTAPADVIAAALHGEKHSLQHYPRSDELAEVVPLADRRPA